MTCFLTLLAGAGGLAAATFGSTAHADVFSVPADFPTIQAAIDAASDRRAMCAAAVVHFTPPIGPRVAAGTPPSVGLHCRRGILVSARDGFYDDPRS